MGTPPRDVITLHCGVLVPGVVQFLLVGCEKFIPRKTIPAKQTFFSHCSIFSGIATSMSSRRVSKMTGLVVVVLLFGGSDATIRIVDSGREFRSWPDPQLGPTLAQGEIFKARLQQIKGNSYFCSDLPTENWKVTVPDDGLPVAVYVKRGLCNYETKARHASKYLPDIVQFLIIDGDHHLVARSGEEDTSQIYEASEELVEPSIGMDNNKLLLSKEPRGAGISDHNLEFTTSSSSVDIVSRALRRQKKPPTDNDQFTISVLHVSDATGYSLLDLLLEERPSTLHAGGTMIRLTGDTPSNRGELKKMILLIVLVLLGMSVTLCLMRSISTLLEATQPVQQQAPYRSRPCRLTPWQVRRKFPQGVFDGFQLNFVPPKQQRHCENRQGSDKARDDAETSPVPAPFVLSDDTCTICLDEFSPGDRIRCLPCQHCFHSPCISKWLTERVATCPLCKIDLYESDDDDDEDSSVGQTPLASSWNSIPPETLAVSAEQANQIPHSLENSTESTTERWQRRGRALGSWSRSLFRRRRDSEPGDNNPSTTTSSLTEPLLPEGRSSDIMQMSMGAMQEEETPELVTQEESSPSCPLESPPLQAVAFAASV